MPLLKIIYRVIYASLLYIPSCSKFLKVYLFFYNLILQAAFASDAAGFNPESAMLLASASICIITRSVFFALSFQLADNYPILSDNDFTLHYHHYQYSLLTVNTVAIIIYHHRQQEPLVIISIINILSSCYLYNSNKIDC
jgi:hypothetical protein